MNKITGENPQPIIEDEPVDLSHNQPALELCEEVGRLATEARDGMLSKALVMSREQCNNLIATQNVRIAEQTQQVKNLELSNRRFVNELRADVWTLSKEVKESNNQLSKSLNQTLSKISKTVTGIEHQVSTATEKATNEAIKSLNHCVDKMTENAVRIVNESGGKVLNAAEKAKEEIDKVKDDIYFERGFRKFMFWLSPVLAIAQTVLLIMLAL